MNKKIIPIKVKNVISNYDYKLMILVIFICAFGLLMIYSASSYRAAYFYNDSSMYFRRQGMFFVAGTVLMVLISLIDYRVYFRRIKLIRIRPVELLYLVCIGLHWYIFFAGYSVGGSARWIQLGSGINFQPSELSKGCFVLGGAFVAAKKKMMINTGSMIKNTFGFIFMFLLFAPILMPVALQNLSSAVILAGILACIYFIVSMEKKYFLFVMAVLAGCGIAMILIKGYRSERLDHFFHPETMDSADQIMQGLYAIGSGGWFGRGVGRSLQKLGNMPEVHTDMIFTVICEELGLVGGIALILLYLLILRRILKIAVNAPDIYGTLVAAGVLAQVALQFIMNIAVVTNSMPATGVPLPFVSYGGSSLLILMSEIGLVLSISNRTYTPVPEAELEQSEQTTETE